MNWTNLITDLLQRGYGYASIGRSLKPPMTGAAIRAMHLHFQKDTTWHVGQQLIAMHKKAMRKYPRIDTAA